MDWRDWEALRLLAPTWTATKSALAWPDLKRWLKHATLFFLAYGLLGGGGGGSGGNLDLGGEEGGSGGVSAAGASMLMLAVAAFVGLAIFVYLGLLLMSSITKFTVLDALAAPDARIASSISRNRNKGIKVFFLELLLIVVLLATIALAIAPFVLAGIAGAGGGILIIAVIGGILALVAVLLVTAVGFWLIRLVLDDFAIPIMHAHETGLWESLGNGARLLRAQGTQGLAYLGVRLLLSIAFGVVRMAVGFMTFFAVALVVGAIAAVTVLPAALAYGVGMASFAELVPKNPSSLLIAGALGVAIVFFFGVSLVVRYVSTVLALPAYVYVRLFSLGFLAGRDTAVAAAFPVLGKSQSNETGEKTKPAGKGAASKDAMQTPEEKRASTSSAKKKAATKKKTAKKPSKKTGKKKATTKKKGSNSKKPEK